MKKTLIIIGVVLIALKLSFGFKQIKYTWCVEEGGYEENCLKTEIRYKNAVTVFGIPVYYIKK